MPAARSAARPAGLIRSDVHGTSKVAVTSTGRPKAASRSAIDALMSSSAGQPTKVGRISTRIGPSPASTDVDAMDDPEIDDREHRELRVHHLGEGGADGRLVDGGAPARTPAIAADRARATPIWIPASLTRSLPGRRGGRR